MLKRCLRILKLALPVMISQISLIIVSFADNVMVGHYSTEALAASSFCINLFNIVVICGLGFSYGVTPLVGKLFARNEKRQIGQLMRVGIIANVSAGIILTLIMGCLYLFVDRMGQPEELLPIIKPYYLINLLSLVFLAVFNAFAQWSYAIKNTSMPMWILLSCNLINIIGNYALIYGHFGAPELGLTGAGISTLFVRILAATAIAIVYFRKESNREYRIGFINGRILSEKSLMRKLIQTSWPVALQMTFETSAFSVCAVFAGWMGKVPLAAYQIILVIGQLGFCIYYSIGMAIAVLVMLFFAAIAMTVFIGFSRQLMGIFTTDEAVLLTAQSLIIPLAIYQLGDATQITFANALRGTAHVMPMLWIAFVSYVVVGLSSSWVIAFPCGMGIYGIVLSFSISLFLAAALFLRQFLKITSK